MKKYIIVIIIMLYCIIDVVPAKAEDYTKTIDYRYTFLGYDGSRWYNGAWTQWRLDRDFNFTDNNTDTVAMVNSQYGTTTITCVDLISSTDGHFYFKGRKVAGGAGTIQLSNTNVDYIYKYPTSTVDTDYTFTFSLSNPANIAYNWVKVYIYGISRADDSYTLKETVYYRRNPGTGEYAYGDNYTYTGNDGYNWKGFVMRIDTQCVNDEVYLDDNMYELWQFTSSFDTFTPDINYGEQLDNINGTLGSIYSSITGGFTNISNAITQLPITIANAVKNLFVYDDWQDDIEDIANDIQIPYLQQITLAFSDVLEQFQWYQPEHEFTIKIPYGNQYLVNSTYDLQTITKVQIIGQYKLIDLIHVMVKFTSFAYVIALLGKIFAIFGFHYWEYLNPIIQKAGGVDE